MYALIINGAVSEITEINPAGRFHPSLEWIACPGDVLPGWSYLNGTFSPPPPVQEDLSLPRTVQIQTRLSEIDLATMRPLRALQLGEGTESDQQKLIELEAEAKTLREELRMLEGGQNAEQRP